MCRVIGGERRSEGGGYLVRGLATLVGDSGWQARSIFQAGTDTQQSVVGTAVQQPSAESTKHTCVQGHTATSCDQSEVKDVVGVVPLVLCDGKSSCSRGRRVKSRQGGEPFSELLVFKK